MHCTTHVCQQDTLRECKRLMGTLAVAERLVLKYSVGETSIP